MKFKDYLAEKAFITRAINDTIEQLEKENKGYTVIHKNYNDYETKKVKFETVKISGWTVKYVKVKNKEIWFDLDN